MEEEILRDLTENIENIDEICYSLQLILEKVPQKINLIDKIFKRTAKHKEIVKFLKNYIIEKKLKNFKYKGRYVFQHFFGCYEFFSAVFSFISVLIVVKKYCEYKRRKSTKKLDFHFYAAFSSFLSAFLLHVHENNFTQKADYLTAQISIIYTALLLFTHTGFILSHSIVIYHAFKNIAYILIFINIYNQYFLNKFDCKFNKIISGGFGVLLFSNMIIHAFIHQCSMKKLHLFKSCLFLVFCLFFEIIDFPPFKFLLDSHACWHFCLIFFYCNLSEYLLLEFTEI